MLEDTLSDFKIYYKATVIKTVVWYKDISMENTDSTLIVPLLSGRLIFNKVQRQSVHWRKDWHFCMCCQNRTLQAKKMNFHLYLASYTKINSKYIIDLNYKTRNTGETLYYLLLSKDLTYNTKASFIKEKNDKLNFIKIKHFSSKDS